MTLGVKVIRKSGIMVSKFIGALLILLYLGQSVAIIYLVQDRHELEGILREQQIKINELEEKLKVGLKLRPVWKEERVGDMFDIAYFEPL